MKKYLYLRIVIVVLASAVFLEIFGTVLAANGASDITVAEFSVENSGILPTSPFYFFKEWMRGLERFFTFNSVKKAELELRIINEKAAEALTIKEIKPDNAEALATALENYIKAEVRLQDRLMNLEETSENPNVEKLLEKLNEQTLKHATLLNQLAERWNTDPYAEDANAINPQATRDDHLQSAMDIAQKKIQEIVVTAAEKDKNIEQKAVEQIRQAETAIKELEFGLAEFAINEPNASNEKTGPIRIDSTPARISTNITMERQTPKTDFGDRIKSGLDMTGGILANAKKHFDLAQASFKENKFGEAFGQARSAEVIAKNGLRIANKLIKDGADADAPRIEDLNSAMPIIPGAGKTKEEIIPEAEKRVFPETNNRTTCDDRAAPACPRGEISECYGGKWTCIGPATGNGIIVVPQENSSLNNSDIKSSEILNN